MHVHAGWHRYSTSRALPKCIAAALQRLTLECRLPLRRMSARNFTLLSRRHWRPQ